VDIEEIKKNNFDLSISRYKPIEYEEVEYDKPNVIIKKIMSLENEVKSQIEEIQNKING
jgi:type I restriction enzyme M protein